MATTKELMGSATKIPENPLTLDLLLRSAIIRRVAGDSVMSRWAA
jgi:hypothetical protein